MYLSSPHHLKVPEMAESRQISTGRSGRLCLIDRSADKFYLYIRYKSVTRIKWTLFLALQNGCRPACAPCQSVHPECMASCIFLLCTNFYILGDACSLLNCSCSVDSNSYLW